eukprot:snap_masked-scaffold_11-processed-gene-12.29-mRNA-1 protein AED:1.00 eAED:1.00 QI:0/-1/0/0/-1/1/1/0/304
MEKHLKIYKNYSKWCLSSSNSYKRGFETEYLESCYLPLKGFQVDEREEVSHNVVRIKVNIPKEHQKAFFNLGVPGTVFIYSEEIDRNRPYDPITQPENDEYLEFLIKAYPEKEGSMGTFLFNAEVGTELQLATIPKKLFYGKPYEKNRWRFVAFFACGTGLAPVLQFLRRRFNDEGKKEDDTKVFLILANRKKEDILLVNELQKIQEENHDHFFLTLILSREEKNETKVNFEEGRVRKDIIEKYLCTKLNDLGINKNDGFVFVVGTDEFRKTLIGEKFFRPLFFGKLEGVLDKVGFQLKQVYVL